MLASPVPEAEIRAFLEREDVKYQRIELPYGLATPGAERTQAKDVSFEEGVAGRSVLDIGSFLGAMCLEALERGAERAVGIELNRERLRQAETIARFKSLAPEYLRADIETWSPEEAFDIVLCLNVLHHLRDPLGVLRKLAICARERLVIEAAGFGEHDAAKQTAGNRLLTMFRRERRIGDDEPFAYVGPYSPSRMQQSYFFTAAALKNILDGHMRLFQRIEEIPSEHKGRYLLRCTRLQIDRLVVVAGTCASGKSTLCESIARNERNGVLDLPDMSAARLIAPSHLWPRRTGELFPEPKCRASILHYDIALTEGFGLHHHGRDPSTDLIRNAAHVDLVIVAPSRETLKRQLIASESVNGTFKNKRHRRYFDLYDRPEWLRELYLDWIEFCGTLIPGAKFHLYVEEGGGRTLVPGLSGKEAGERVAAIYRA